MIARVFLIGARGSGKSTVGRALASRLGWDWIDADIILESRAGSSIREIFASEGELGFRQREAELLAEFAQLERHIIATGGGVILRPENRLMLRLGWTVWLSGDAATLWSRISGDETTQERRPALGVGGLAEVTEVLARRASLYAECADVCVDTTGKSPEWIVEEILRRGEAGFRGLTLA